MSREPLRATTDGPWPSVPDLVVGEPNALHAAFGRRRAAFTPDWQPGVDDPGAVLSRALASQLAIVARQTNRLVDRLARELLNIGAVPDGPAGASTAIVRLVIDPAAPASVVLPERSTLLGPARHDGLPSVLESTRAVQAQPLVLSAVVSQIGSSFYLDEAEPGRALPQPIEMAAFGSVPSPGNALWLGFDGLAEPGSLSLHLATGAPVTPSGAVIVEWAVVRPDGEVPVVVSLDETEAFTRSGIVEISLPAGWEPTAPPTTGRTRHWLIARLISGGYERSPRLVGVQLNAVRAEGTETRRDEPVETTEDPTADRSRAIRYWLGRTPVMRGTVVLRTERAGSVDPFMELSPSPGDDRWTEVESFAGAHSSGRFFVVDPASGELSFPNDAPSFGRITALEYRVSGGIVELPAGTPLTLQNAPAFVSGAVTIAGASRGTALEAPESAVRNGPARLRSGGRAITSSDYETEALRVAGTGIVRALAQPGTGRDGSPAPGTVRLVVVGSRPDASGRYVVGDAALSSLAERLEEHVAPIGVHVVAVPAEFASVRIEAQLVVRRGADPGAVAARCVDAINRYVSPLPSESENGAGFAFGGVVEHRAVVARLARIDGVEQVDAVLVVNGRRARPCGDVPLGPTAVPYSLAHLITVTTGALR